MPHCDRQRVMNAKEVASVLREIRQDKILTLSAHKKNRNEDLIARYNSHIMVLDRAIHGYDRLAER